MKDETKDEMKQIAFYALGLLSYVLILVIPPLSILFAIIGTGLITYNVVHIEMKDQIESAVKAKDKEYEFFVKFHEDFIRKQGDINVKRTENVKKN